MTKLIEEVFGKETFEGMCAVLDERDALRKQVESLQEENAALYARLNVLERKAEKADNRRRDALTGMKHFKSELRKVREEKESALKELETVKKDRDALRDVMRGAGVIVPGCGCVCEEMEWTDARLSSALKELERVQEDRDALEAEAQELRNALKEAEETAPGVDLDEEYFSLWSNFLDVKRQLKEAEDARERAERDAADYLAQLIGLQEDKEEAQQRRTESALAVEDLEEEYQSLRTAFLELQRQLKESLEREDEWKTLWEAAVQVLNSVKK